MRFIGENYSITVSQDFINPSLVYIHSKDEGKTGFAFEFRKAGTDDPYTVLHYFGENSAEVFKIISDMIREPGITISGDDIGYVGYY